jgi:murein DD-endopeptidase MepM/ murein hydrolase activator NlpD
MLRRLWCNIGTPASTGRDSFYTLYGHLRLADINSLKEGQYVSRGQQIAAFGEMHENGNWPPHLHFQIISDMELKKGDYPVYAGFRKERNT